MTSAGARFCQKILWDVQKIRGNTLRPWKTIFSATWSKHKFFHMFKLKWTTHPKRDYRFSTEKSRRKWTDPLWGVVEVIGSDPKVDHASEFPFKNWARCVGLPFGVVELRWMFFFFGSRPRTWVTGPAGGEKEKKLPFLGRKLVYVQKKRWFCKRRQLILWRKLICEGRSWFFKGKGLILRSKLMLREKIEFTKERNCFVNCKVDRREWKNGLAKENNVVWTEKLTFLFAKSSFSLHKSNFFPSQKQLFPVTKATFSLHKSNFFPSQKQLFPFTKATFSIHKSNFFHSQKQLFYLQDQHFSFTNQLFSFTKSTFSFAKSIFSFSQRFSFLQINFFFLDKISFWYAPSRNQLVPSHNQLFSFAESTLDIAKSTVPFQKSSFPQANLCAGKKLKLGREQLTVPPSTSAMNCGREVCNSFFHCKPQVCNHICNELRMWFAISKNEGVRFASHNWWPKIQKSSIKFFFFLFSNTSHHSWLQGEAFGCRSIPSVKWRVGIFRQGSLIWARVDRAARRKVGQWTPW